MLRQTIHIYAQLGIAEETVRAIETFFSIPNPMLPPVLLAEVAYPAIRDHPRFQALLQQYAVELEH